jgi:hypothetical protein
VSKKGRLWFPLDVDFWDDPDVIAVGDGAAILFQRLIGYSKRQQLDGLVPMAVVRNLGGRRWREKLEPLVSRGLAEVSANEAPVCPPTCAQFVANLAAIAGAKWCRVVAYLAWNDSSNEIEERRKISAEKKRAQRAAIENVPGGQRRDVPRDHAPQEAEAEIDLSPSEKGSSVERPSDGSPTVDPADEIRSLESVYPPGLCSEARDGCALSRRNGRMADSVWLLTLRKLSAFPVAVSTGAMRVFVEKHADGDKGEAYLVAIARREASSGRSGARKASVATPGTHELFDASYVPERDDPELAWKGAANA